MHGMTADAVTSGQARRLTTVVAADICGYSRLAEIDDEAAVRTVQMVRAVFDAVVARRRGRVFHSSGDGFLAEFPSATDGALAALDFVADIKARDTLSPMNTGAKVRVGVHSGDVMEQPNGDLLGHGVNIAARLQQEAAPNGVLASEAAVRLTGGKVATKFTRRGPVALKNLGQPVTTYEASERRGLQVPDLIGKVRTFPVLATAVSLIVLLSWISMAGDLTPEHSAPQSDLSGINSNISSLADRLADEINPHRDEEMLLAAQDAARSLLESEVPAKRKAVELINQGQLIEAAKTLETALLEQQRSSVKLSAQAQSLREIGAVAFYADTPAAITAYERLYDLDPRDPLAIYQLGRLSARVNKPNRALAYFAALEELAEPNSPMMLRALAGSVDARITLGALEGLDKEISAGLDLARRLGFAREQADLLSAFAVWADFTDDEALMLEYQKQAILIENAIDRPERILDARTTYGAMLLEAGRYDEAQNELAASLALAEQLADRQSAGSILYNLAYLSLESGDYATAASFAERALLIANADQRPQLIELCQTLLADASVRGGPPHENCEALEDSQNRPDRPEMEGAVPMPSIADQRSRCIPALQSDQVSMRFQP